MGRFNRVKGCKGEMMAISSNKREQAFHLFCMGVPYEKIALVVGSGKATIPRWIDKYEWRKRKEELSVVTKENDVNDKEVLNGQLLESVKKVWAKSVTDGTARASAGDLVKVVTLERLVAGESTENVAIMSHVSIGQAYKEFLEKEAKEKEDN